MTTELGAQIRAALADNPGAVLEDIARRFAVTMRDVLDLLPPGEVAMIPGGHFEHLMRELTRWGELTFLVNTGDVIVEVRGSLPEGSLRQGWYNLHGQTLGGHIKADACECIAFVSRKLFNQDTHSVQFLNDAGACLFKLYLGRDANRQLLPEQVSGFLALRDRLVANTQAIATGVTA